MNVARASTRVPNAVASEGAVDQSPMVHNLPNGPARNMEGEVRVETDGYHTFMEERDAGARSEPGDELERPAQARMHLRLRRRLLIGGSVGAIAGAVIGALFGLLFFDRSAAVVMSIVAAGVFGLGVGMLIAGYSSLESPDPGAEPSDTARPVADRPEAVREEHPEVPDTPTTGLDD
jgi:hypothetical protein